MNPNRAAAQELVRQANACHRQERYQEAIDMYRQAMALMPDSPVFIAYNYMIGDMLFELGRYDEAAQAFRTAVTAVPEHSEAWFRLGQCLERLRRDDEAAAAIQRSVEILSEQRAEDEALGTFESCAELDRRLAQAWYLGATVHARLGNAAQVRECLERAVALRPGWARRVHKDQLLRQYFTGS